MNNVLVMLAIVLLAVFLTTVYRRRRDQQELTDRVGARNGQVLQLKRVNKGHPFPDTGRGWWAWRIDWRDGAGEHRSWALTTRDGIKEWRD